jgi:hypothetical protein
MKIALTLLALVTLAVAVRADDTSNNNGTVLVQNGHGGYNVTQLGAAPATLPFFGAHGAAAQMVAESHEKPKFLLVPAGTQDDGHGGKHQIYKKLRFATAEDAAAAKAKLTP